MPSFTKCLSSVALALAALAPLASAEVKQIQHNGKTLTLTKGSVNADDDLSKRNDAPQGCTFGDRLTYKYIQITDLDDGPACIGWASSVHCGDGPWPDPDRGYIQEVLAEQVTKDGQFKYSDVEEWHAAFQTLTTAFAIRDTAPFNEVLEELDEHALTIYWSRAGDYAELNRSSC